MGAAQIELPTRQTSMRDPSETRRFFSTRQSGLTYVCMLGQLLSSGVMSDVARAEAEPGCD